MHVLVAGVVHAGVGWEHQVLILDRGAAQVGKQVARVRLLVCRQVGGGILGGGGVGVDLSGRGVEVPLQGGTARVALSKGAGIDERMQGAGCHRARRTAGCHICVPVGEGVLDGTGL